VVAPIATSIVRAEVYALSQVTRTSRDEHDTRLLARRSEHGYVTNPAEAMHGEPEAVTEAEQQKVTRDARLAAKARRVQHWERTRRFIDIAISRFELTTDLKAEPGLDGALHSVKQRLDAVDRRIGVPDGATPGRHPGRRI
jgi:hypothetical protein